MDQAPLLPGSTATGERDRLITAFAQVAAECGVQNTTVEAVPNSRMLNVLPPSRRPQNTSLVWRLR